MKKKLYESVRSELENRCRNLRFFNPGFFDLWIKAVKSREKAIKNDTVDSESYVKNGIKLYHYYDEVYASDFYNKNGGTYCEFLSVVMKYDRKIAEL